MAGLATLGRIFDEHRVRLEAMIDRRLDPALRARTSSKDILQDAYILAKSRWPDFQRRLQSGSLTGSGPSTFSWLYRLSLDALIDAWRKHSSGPRDVRREMPLPESSTMQLGCNLIEPGAGPATQFQLAEVRELVRKAMAKLKDSDREILWMRKGDQLSFSEISEVLEITVNVASVRFTRALRRLGKIWQELYPDFGSTL